ncbi:MAG: cell division protein SepF [Coriobacteriales bacterium]|jgi:cell division inhibitor SepF|nr:cell division protein SepF [Coriobacteriales bacterium]
MGIFDTIKSRLSGADHDAYAQDNAYDENEEYHDAEYEEDFEADEYYQDDEYYDDAADDAIAASNRKPSVFNDYTPLVSMSDVRSQELPRIATVPSAAPVKANRAASATRTRQASPQIRNSLPYVGNPADALDPSRGAYLQQYDRYEDEGDPSRYDTGSLSAVPLGGDSIYAAEDSVDPLLKRHSLSNTGDFSTTSPAYYASRSGVGHVRPAGQTRRTLKFREAIVINPESYAEAEQVAINLRRGNAVVLVLAHTRPELAKRILDFSFGAAAVAEGQVASIGERIYALTCDHPLTENEMELLKARGVL